MKSAIDEIHAYWFGELDETGHAQPGRHSLWFKASAETEADCRRRLRALVQRAVAG